MRADLQVVAGLVPAGSQVLDLGCGDGSLLEHLMRERDCRGSGVEISDDGFLACLERGVPVLQGDIDRGLDGIADDHYDVVILSQTLHALRRPAFVVQEMMRVAECAVLSFPNFGHWRARAQLALRGRMPVSRTLPHPWYDTPNIHLCTLLDFQDLTVELGLRAERCVLLDADGRPAPERVGRRPNLLAAGAVYRITRP
ncbi:MAG: methionine biosynthesis protein MetW [Miltoncostaeaceae bacterium]